MDIYSTGTKKQQKIAIRYRYIQKNPLPLPHQSPYPLIYYIYIRMSTPSYNNPQQQQVIDTQQGECLVLAPPGCGKTHILAERIARALELGREVQDMLCLTFTNRAARGMRNRITERMGCDVEQLFVGNVHRYCSGLLYEQGRIGGDYGILDEVDANDIIHTICARTLQTPTHENVHMTHNYQHFMQQLRLNIPNELLLHAASLAYKQQLRELCAHAHLPYGRTSLLKIYDYPEIIPPEIAAHYKDALFTMDFARKYEAYKAEHNLVDFDDIIINAYAYLRDTPEHQRYSWIQIDEVQDLNPMQLAIIDLLYNRTAQSSLLYLGDEQQAIFAFLGAKKETLEQLKLQCEGYIFRLSENFRSPRHLLNVFNDFAQANLGVHPDLLSTTTREMEGITPEHLSFCFSESNAEEAENIVHRLLPHLCENKEETVAVIVPTNKDADLLCNLMTDIPHFKISGVDLFSTPDMKTLLAHLNVITNEHSHMAWAHLLTALGIEPSSARSRAIINRLKQLNILPTDLLLYTGETYLSAFCRAYEEETLVIYDTETTGLDVFNDEIVQLAAFKVKGGKKIEGSDFEVILHTDRKIPEMLGDLPNPLLSVYAATTPLPRREGLEKFVAYAEGCILVGHNVNYDNRILHNNLLSLGITSTLPLTMAVGADVYAHSVFDTLKLARLLFPRQHNHKLKTLLENLGLEGKNSHLADDDIFATFQLLKHCYAHARPLVSEQLEKLRAPELQRIANRLTERYAIAFYHAQAALMETPETPTPQLIREIHFATEELGLHIEKLDYFTDYLRYDILNTVETPYLLQQLERHTLTLNTLKEADLCDSESMRRRGEQVFVTTVHKAKGLEFDNVIVSSASREVYPFYNSKTDEEQREDARKFYVAISRAKRRLYISYYNLYHMTDRHGTARTFSRGPSPFLESIAPHFSHWQF